MSSPYTATVLYRFGAAGTSGCEASYTSTRGLASDLLLDMTPRAKGVRQ